MILVAVYCTIEEPNNNYYAYDCSYLDNNDLDLAYDFLGKLGYEMSDEEKELKDGTHKLFRQRQKTE